MKQEIDRRDLECPHFKKTCRKVWERCAFKMAHERVHDNGDRVVIYGCASYIAAEGLDGIANRLAMVHKEAGEAKQAAMYQALALLTDSPVVKGELARLVSAAANGLIASS